MNVSVVIETSFGSLTVNTLPQGMSICKHLAFSLVCVTEAVLLNLTIEPWSEMGFRSHVSGGGLDTTRSSWLAATARSARAPATEGLTVGQRKSGTGLTAPVSRSCSDHDLLPRPRGQPVPNRGVKQSAGLRLRVLFRVIRVQRMRQKNAGTKRCKQCHCSHNHEGAVRTQIEIIARVRAKVKARVRKTVSTNSESAFASGRTLRNDITPLL